MKLYGIPAADLNASRLPGRGVWLTAPDLFAPFSDLDPTREVKRLARAEARFVLATRHPRLLREWWEAQLAPRDPGLGLCISIRRQEDVAETLRLARSFPSRWNMLHLHPTEEVDLKPLRGWFSYLQIGAPADSNRLTPLPMATVREAMAMAPTSLYWGGWVPLTHFGQCHPVQDGKVALAITGTFRTYEFKDDFVRVGNFVCPPLVDGKLLNAEWNPQWAEPGDQPC